MIKKDIMCLAICALVASNLVSLSSASAASCDASKDCKITASQINGDNVWKIQASTGCILIQDEDNQINTACK